MRRAFVLFILTMGNAGAMFGQLSANNSGGACFSAFSSGFCLMGALTLWRTKNQKLIKQVDLKKKEDVK